MISEMTDPQQVRVGDAERDAATASLGQQMRDGRLSSDEYSDRSTKAAAAVTRADLDALVADLPVGQRLRAATVPPATSLAQTAFPASGPSAAAPPDQVSSKRTAAAARWVAVGGPIAFILFMVFGLAFDGWAWSWLFFLVPGVLGIWMYSDDYFRGRAIAHTDRAAYRAERNSARRIR